MTDENHPNDANTVVRDFMEEDRVFKALCESVRDPNKKVLFDALEAAGITSVIVHFDGCGDSGQIEEIDAVAGDQPRSFPSGTVALAHPRWGDSEAETIESSIRDAVETLAYGFLEETHGGWENNEGAYGEFTFDVTLRLIVLDYNERVETSEYSQHSF
jgi:hypothetical protein